MPAKRKPTNEVKITTVTVKLSKPEKEHLVKLSKSYSISKSDVIRTLLLNAEKMIESEGHKMIIFDKVYDMDTGNVEEQPVRG